MRLAGTECAPAGAGPFPHVVFVRGSGPLDSDENMEGQDVFNVLARRLAAAGIASFRYDERGCGASTGNFQRAGLADLISDARKCAETIGELPSCSQVFVVLRLAPGVPSLLKTHELLKDAVASEVLDVVTAWLVRHAEDRDADASGPEKTGHGREPFADEGVRLVDCDDPRVSIAHH